MADYLAALEGYILEDAVEQTDFEKKDKGGKANVKALAFEGATERSTETKRRLAITDAAKFQKLYELMDEQDLIQPLGAFDKEIWEQLHKGEFIEVEVTGDLPEVFRMTQAVEDISPLLGIMEAIGEEPFADPKARMAFDGIQGAVKLTKGQPIPLICEALSTPGYNFVAHLSQKFLRCEMTDLQGEMTILGKIIRILEQDEKLEVFGLIPSNLLSLANLNRKQRRAMEKKQENASTEGITDVVKGPAIVIAPIAVFR